MNTVSVRDIRQRWPEAEKELEGENEFVITRDSKPVAKLIRYVEPEDAKTCFDPVAHRKWREKTSGRRVVRWLDKLLNEREER